MVKDSRVKGRGLYLHSEWIFSKIYALFDTTKVFSYFCLCGKCRLRHSGSCILAWQLSGAVVSELYGSWLQTRDEAHV